MNLIARFKETWEKDKADHQGYFETFGEIWYMGLRVSKGWQREVKDWFGDYDMSSKDWRSIGWKRRYKEVEKIDKSWSTALHIMRCKDKEQGSTKDDIKDKDRSYGAHNSLIQDSWDICREDIELAKVSKEDEDWSSSVRASMK